MDSGCIAHFGTIHWVPVQNEAIRALMEKHANTAKPITVETRSSQLLEHDQYWVAHQPLEK